MRRRSAVRRCPLSAGALAVAVFLMAGCATAPPPGLGVESASVSASARKPRAVDMDTEFTRIVNSAMRVNAVPGAVVLVRTPDGTWERAFGTRVVGGGDPVTVQDSFRVGSITKTMVGTVMLQLVDEGRVRLDEPVSTYRPDVPNGADITIADLLDMRSGLYSYNENPEFAQTLDNDPGHVWDPEELLRIGLAGTPYFAPGEGYRYSNTNTILVGLIIRQITGKSVSRELRDRIFAPIGMQHSSFPVPSERDLPPNSPHGYLYGTNVSALRSPVLPDDEEAQVRTGALLPTDVTRLDPSWIWAAGGVISTAADIARYAEALVDGSKNLLRPATQQERMLSVGPRAINPATMQYGLGIAAFGPMLGHDGAIPGFQSFMGRDAERQITVVVFCTVRDGPRGGRPANEIAYDIVRLLYGTR